MTTDIVKWITRTPTIDTAAYADGDLVGTKMEFDLSGFRGLPDLLLVAICLTDLAKQDAALDLVLFDSDPSGTTFTDNAALAIADADVPKIIGVVPVSTYHDFSDNSIGIKDGMQIPLSFVQPNEAMTLYAVLVSRGTPTYAAATDLKVRLGFAALG